MAFCLLVSSSLCYHLSTSQSSTSPPPPPPSPPLVRGGLQGGVWASFDVVLGPLSLGFYPGNSGVVSLGATP